jgi:hypothetical protein
VKLSIRDLSKIDLKLISFLAVTVASEVATYLLCKLWNMMSNEPARDGTAKRPPLLERDMSDNFCIVASTLVSDRTCPLSPSTPK